MTGTELLLRVRREHPRMIRILLTASTKLAHNMQAIQDGAVYRFLTKPVSAEELEQTLAHAFKMAQLLRQRQSLAPSRR